MRNRSILSRFLILLMAFALVAAACGGDDDDAVDEGATDDTVDPSELDQGGSITIAGEQEPSGLNWLTAADNAAWTQYIMQLVWPGAVVAQPDGAIDTNADLVESMELVQEDPQVVEYQINPDAKWSDGTDITANDFAFMWRAQNGKELSEEIDPETGDPLPLFDVPSTTGYEIIDSVEGGDTDTVTVNYSAKFADWNTLFDYIFPEHYFTDVGEGDPAAGWNTGFKIESLPDIEGFVSGGPYNLVEYTPGESMVLARNEQYYGEPGLVDEFVVPFIEDATQQPAALEEDDADVIFPQAQIDLVDQTEGIQGVQTFVGFGTFWEHIDFNFQNSHLAQLEVRQAIGKAIDRQEVVSRLVDPFDDSAEVLNNRIFFPNQSTYEPNGEEEFGEVDQEAARSLLEDAGYTEGSDGVYEKDGERLSLRITWVDPNPRRQQTAQLVQDQLSEVGIEVEFAPQEDFVFLDEGNFDLALFGWTGSASLASNTSIYVTEGGQNYGKYSNTDVDDLFAQADVELDPDTRADLLNQADAIMWEDLPTLAMFQVPEFLAWRDGTENVVYNGFQGFTWNAATWSAPA